MCSLEEYLEILTAWGRDRRGWQGLSLKCFLEMLSPPPTSPSAPGRVAAVTGPRYFQVYLFMETEYMKENVFVSVNSSLLELPFCSVRNCLN